MNIELINLFFQQKLTKNEIINFLARIDVQINKISR